MIELPLKRKRAIITAAISLWLSSFFAGPALPAEVPTPCEAIRHLLAQPNLPAQLAIRLKETEKILCASTISFSPGSHTDQPFPVGSIKMIMARGDGSLPALPNGGGVLRMRLQREDGGPATIEEAAAQPTAVLIGSPQDSAVCKGANTDITCFYDPTAPPWFRFECWVRLFGPGIISRGTQLEWILLWIREDPSGFPRGSWEPVLTYDQRCDPHAPSIDAQILNPHVLLVKDGSPLRHTFTDRFPLPFGESFSLGKIRVGEPCEKVEIPTSQQWRQFESPWGPTDYDHLKSTMAISGCSVTSAAVVLKKHGLNTDPGSLNEELKKRPEGFDSKNPGALNWDDVATFSTQNGILLEYDDAPFSLATMRQDLKKGQPVILFVDSFSKPGKGHFVVATKTCDDNIENIQIHDVGRGAHRGINTLKDYFDKATNPQLKRRIRGLRRFIIK